jgi:homoserine dehydrogenase
MTAPSSADGPRVSASPLRVALLGLGTVGRAVARGLTTDAPRGLTTDAPRGLTTDGPRGLTTDAPRGLTTDSPRGLTTDAPRGLTTDSPRGLTTDGTRPLSATDGSRSRWTAGREVRLVAVADRDASRFEALDLRDVERLDDGSALIGRPDIDVVVELIGGIDTAGRLVASALDAGQSVVTANKALLARRGVELERLARERGAALRFEAAVGGAIPVLATLAGDLAANRIDRVRGIVNGSTNFVLTEMSEAGAAYDEVVARAKSLGFLEADPGTDVEGRDAADKLAILVRLAFGAWPDVAAIRRAPPALRGDGPAGITGVTVALIDVARREHLAVKLVAQASRDDAGVISAWVLPVAVPVGDPLARTAGAENRIEIVGHPVGSVAFVGAGAGGAPTSSAVLGDLLAIARGEGSTWAGLPAATELPAERLADGMGVARRWLACDLPGEGGFTSATSLADLRARLTGSGLNATLFPILEGD